MKTISKGHAPHSLTQYRRTPDANYEDYAQKDELRMSLAVEQGYICCYCMQRIRPAIGGMKIEHWHCQELYRSEQLNYGNLLGACMGNEGKPRSQQHCDTRKGNAELSRNPANPGHRVEDFVHYLVNGRIESHNDQFNRELNETLNLNAPLLVNNRKAVLDGSKRGLPPGLLDQPTLQRMIDKWSVAIRGELLPFCGIVIH